MEKDLGLREYLDNHPSVGKILDDVELKVEEIFRGILDQMCLVPYHDGVDTLVLEIWIKPGNMKAAYERLDDLDSWLLETYGKISGKDFSFFPIVVFEEKYFVRETNEY